MSIYHSTGIFSRATRIDTSFYGYVPDRATSIVFLAFFAISTVAHIGQGIHYRKWWLLPTVVLCGLLELLGWAARLWSSYDPGLAAPYEMQLTCTILAPTPLLAANFLIMERIILRLGPQYSRLSPKWYTIVFCTSDVISLVVQAIGGGTAATAVAQDTNPENGGNIMLGGIAFQMAVITVYALCAVEFFVRYIWDKPVHRQGLSRGYLTTKLKLLSGALGFSTLCLFIRAVYRTIELADGWTGRIILTEVYFNVLDGAMVILAIYTVNILHPGLLLNAKVLASDGDIEKPQPSPGPVSVNATARTSGATLS